MINRDIEIDIVSMLKREIEMTIIMMMVAAAMTMTTTITTTMVMMMMMMAGAMLMGYAVFALVLTFILK